VHDDNRYKCILSCMYMFIGWSPVKKSPVLFNRFCLNFWHCIAALTHPHCVMRGKLCFVAALLICCCEARLRRLQDLNVVTHSAPKTTAASDESILKAVQRAQSVFMKKLLSKYGSQYEHKLFKDAFYELSDSGAAIQRRFLQRMVHQGNFTMAFTGISNTAGTHSMLLKLYALLC
jgi:hypothetical protein